ncbi:MAG: hypothetical protein V3U52_07555, partial [Thermoplasmata archaeon]
MSVIHVFKEEDSTSVEDEKIRRVIERLSDTLAQLNFDERDPELWAKAAKGFLALGDFEKSLNCCMASLKVDDGRGNARLLMFKAQELIKAHGVKRGVSRQYEAETQPIMRGGKQPMPEHVKGEDANLSTPNIRWLPEWETPRPDSEEGTRKDLREELIPQTTAICPVCNTLIGVEKKWCHGCGREMKEKVEPLERQVKSARARLQSDEEDRDALFTMGAYFAVMGQHQEALMVLN